MLQRRQRMAAMRSAYRSLLGAGMAADEAVGKGDGNVVLYIRARVRQEVARVRARALDRGQPQSQAAFKRNLHNMELYHEALTNLDELPQVAAIVKALSTGAGNHAYRQQLERAILTAPDFARESASRSAADDDATDMRQNRVMLQALLPYAEKLVLLHDDCLSTGAKANAMTARRSTTLSQLVDLESSSHKELLFVETDDTLLRQIVYVRADPFDLDAPRINVETRELQSMRNSVAHAEYLAVAERLTASLLEESRLHRSRATVLVGHGVGGAVATLIACLLSADGFSVRNVITLGAPRVFASVTQREGMALNCVRVEVEGDVRPLLPTQSDNRDDFLHIGEALLLASDALPPRPPDAEEAGAEGELYGAADYLRAMSDPKVKIAYAAYGEGDMPFEATPAVFTTDDVLEQDEDDLEGEEGKNANGAEHDNDDVETSSTQRRDEPQSTPPTPPQKPRAARYGPHR